MPTAGDTRIFQIAITSTHPDAEQIARKAAEKVACEVDWGCDQYATVEAVEMGSGVPVHLCSWAMEPGEED